MKHSSLGKAFLMQLLVEKDASCMAAVVKLISSTQFLTAPDCVHDEGGGEGLQDVVSWDSNHVELGNSAQLGDSWHQQVHGHGCCNRDCHIV